MTLQRVTPCVPAHPAHPAQRDEGDDDNDDNDDSDTGSDDDDGDEGLGGRKPVRLHEPTEEEKEHASASPEGRRLLAELGLYGAAAAALPIGLLRYLKKTPQAVQVQGSTPSPPTAVARTLANATVPPPPHPAGDVHG